MAERRDKGIMRRFELPTWGLIIAIYGGWGLLTFFWNALPWPLLLIAGSWLIAWHMSLQHEVLHGHPTKRQSINDAIGFPPLSVWLPYRIYRDSHLAHHNDTRLTDPLDDPESQYLTAEAYARLGPAGRLFRDFYNTLPGRVLIGPAWNIGRFLIAEGRLVLSGWTGRRGIWLRHMIGVIAIGAWLVLICDIPLWHYLLLAVYPGYGLALVRSFAEHRAEEQPEHRTAIVENTPIFGLLFLHNNLHVVHHDRPCLPWYAIPAEYRAHRTEVLTQNRGLLYNGYLDVALRYFFTRHHHPLHPAYRPLPEGSLPTTDALRTSL
jgi:fatty acid desaturase